MRHNYHNRFAIENPFDYERFDDGREFEMWFFHEPHKRVQLSFEESSLVKKQRHIDPVRIEEVKNSQPIKLGIGILDLVGRLRDELDYTVTGFTSLYTVLDYHHGADGFLEVDGKYIFTIDVTTKPTKETTNADFLITRDDIRSHRIDELIQFIAREIERRISYSRS